MSWVCAFNVDPECSAAFIACPNMVLDPLLAKPQISGKDLQEVTTQILAHPPIF